MDIGQIGDDAWTSLRNCWREELWFPAGLVVAAVAYALWLGLTGAALTFLAEAIAGTVTFRPWTSLSTFVVAVVAALWIVGPAALAVVSIVGRVTNVNGNLRVGYRLRHPLLLLGPPATVFAAGCGLLVATGSAGPVVSGVLVLGGVWLATRTTAYAYRVFSLSLPVVAWALLFATAGTVGVATLVLGGGAVGRETLVADVLSGLAARTGFEWVATLHTATATVGGVEVPALVAATVAVPVAGSAAYVGLQLAWSVLTRLRKPAVRRPELRTGQRYPRFARPTTGASPGRVQSPGSPQRPGGGDGSATQSDGRAASGSGTAGAAAAAGGEATVAAADDGTDHADDTGEDGTDADGAEETDDVDEVTHTRVFRPPDDADLEATDGVPEGEGTATGRETTVADGSTPGRRCPDCGESVENGDGVCPDCGRDLESA